MGILIEPENQEALVKAIINNIRNLSRSKFEEKGKNARIYAEKFLEKDKILNNYFSSIIPQDARRIEMIGLAEKLTGQSFIQAEK